MSLKWRSEEIENLKALFPDTETKDIAIALNRSVSSVYGKSNQLSLKRSPEFIIKQQQMFAETLRREGVKTRFQKGLVPFSKGKKREEFMTAAGIEKVQQTQFKKGIIPHNWVPIGHERITKDGYIEVKVSDNIGIDSVKNFELKHRILYEKFHGPIPEGMKIEFLDGVKIDFSIDDLVMRSKGENLMLNCFSKKAIAKKIFKPKNEVELNKILEAADNLLDAKQNQIKLNHLIKSHERKD